MKPLSMDTPLDVERVWLEGLRAQSPTRRLATVASLTSQCLRGAREATRRAHPDWSEQERDAWMIEARYGRGIAEMIVARRQAMGLYASGWTFRAC